MKALFNQFGKTLIMFPFHIALTDRNQSVFISNMRAA